MHETEVYGLVVIKEINKELIKEKSTMLPPGFADFRLMISKALDSISKRCELKELEGFFERFQSSPEDERQYRDIYKKIYERVTLGRTPEAEIPQIQTFKSFDVQKFGLFDIYVVSFLY